MDGEAGHYSRREEDYAPDRDEHRSPTGPKSREEIQSGLLDFLDKIKSARGPRGPFEKEKHYYDDKHREDMVRDLNATDDDEARAMAEEDGHLRTERRQGLVGQGARQKIAAVAHPTTTISHPQTAIGETKYSLSCGKCGHFGQHENYDIAHALAEDHQNQHWVSAHDDKYGQGAHEREFPHLYSEGALTDGSSTDGKIVGLCPGCTRAIRKHKTMHGNELRHLHNNSPRCFGKTSELEPGLLEAGHAAQEVGHELMKPLEEPTDGWGWKSAESALQMYADYLGRPDANNPTGRGPDEYKARTWDSYLTTRPMQSAEDRNVNTPVLPEKPIKTRNINTPTTGAEDNERARDEDEDEDED